MRPRPGTHGREYADVCAHVNMYTLKLVTLPAYSVGCWARLHQEQEHAMVRRTPNRTAEQALGVGYCRVSTAKQVKGGMSMEQQLETIPTYCQQHGLRLLEVHQDAGVSGRTANRPGLQAALTQVQEVKGVLVVPSVSRFGRSVRDVAELTQRLNDAGVRVVFVKEGIDTTTAHGRFMLHMLGALAELEVEQLRERVQGAIDHARAKGLKLGGQAPYGFTVLKVGTKKNGRPIQKLKRCPKEQAVIRRMVALRDEGLGYHVIAAALAAEGVRSRSGKPLNVKVVYEVLKREAKKTREVAA